jgi:uncharacterized protein (DUF3820 family)
MIQPLTDTDILHFGKQHKGSKLANVPASYLLWIYDNCRLPENLKTYIEENKTVLQAEVKRSVKSERR